MKFFSTVLFFFLSSSSCQKISTAEQQILEFKPSLLLKDDNYLSEKKNLFESWMMKFDKEYKTAEETLHRLHVWIKNHELIERHNDQSPEPSYSLDHNQFSDMTWDEFQEYNKLGPYSPGLMSMRKNDDKFVTMDHRSLLEDDDDDDDDVPDEWNWIEEGAVPPVKDQSMCGSCWAFSAIGAIEGARFVDTGNLTALSEQELVDCDKLDMGCNGGLMDNAFLFDENTTHGICSEQDYPYVGHKHLFGGCRSEESKNQSRHYCESVNHSRVKTFVDIENTIPALIKAVAKQPISVAIQVISSFQFYSDGVYSDDECGDMLDHGVLTVGYGEEDDVPYFLVRNSWGENWGDGGYIKMAQQSNTNVNGTCGILSMASRPILRDD